MRNVIAVDLGGTNVAAAEVGERGKIGGEWKSRSISHRLER